MGKGKGTFEYWACRAPIGKVIFEVGGGGIAEQVAKDGEHSIAYTARSFNYPQAECESRSLCPQPSASQQQSYQSTRNSLHVKPHQD